MSISNSYSKTLKEQVIEHSTRILRKLGCDMMVQEEVTNLIERADNQDLLSKGTSKGLAAGIVYIACILREDRMTLDTIGGAIGVSGSTVSKNYMMIARSLRYSEY